MDRITGFAPLAATRPARPTATAVGFRPMRGGEVVSVALDPAADVVPVRDPGTRDRRAAARARAILADLSLLQAGLLGAEADDTVLRRLADSAGGVPPSDPVLAEIVAAASLRAQVELARREGSRGNTVASR